MKGMQVQVAVGAPGTAVEDEGHRSLGQEIRETDLAAVGVRQLKVRRRLAHLEARFWPGRSQDRRGLFHDRSVRGTQGRSPGLGLGRLEGLQGLPVARHGCTCIGLCLCMQDGQQGQNAQGQGQLSHGRLLELGCHDNAP
jgi:hypothetical protein